MTYTPAHVRGWLEAQDPTPTTLALHGALCAIEAGSPAEVIFRAIEQHLRPVMRAAEEATL